MIQTNHDEWMGKQRNEKDMDRETHEPAAAEEEKKQGGGRKKACLIQNGRGGFRGGQSRRR
jgi:hypothetical protein